MGTGGNLWSLVGHWWDLVGPDGELGGADAELVGIGGNWEVWEELVESGVN